MAFTLPVFNILYDRWATPSAPPDPATETNKPAQLYVTSRALLDIEPDEFTFWQPPVWLRVPKGTTLNRHDLIECEPGSGFWYEVRWVERVHLGFANEYLAAVLCQLSGGPPPPGAAALLLEAGDYLLLESGDKILLE